jgi:hypothetical protein
MLPALKDLGIDFPKNPQGGASWEKEVTALLVSPPKASEAAREDRSLAC